MTAVATPTKPKKPPYVTPQRVKLRDEQGGEFQLVAGPHAGEGPADCKCGCHDEQWIGGDPDCEHKERRPGVKSCACRARLMKQDHLYEAYDPRRHGPRDLYTNDFIASPTVDLEKRFINKFVRTSQGSRAAAPAPYPLEELKLRQLLTVAEEEGVDLSKVDTSKKADVVAAIRAAGKA